MSMRSFDVPLQARAFEQSDAFATASPDDPRLLSRRAGNAKRAGLSPEAYRDLLLQVWGRRAEVPAVIAEMAELGRRAGAPMLSHDDTQNETRSYYRSLGARLAEFPMRPEVAEAARDAGDAVIFGAPNVVRGGSHIGSPSAADMVEAGFCDILASDYVYPALLGAVARLCHERRGRLEDLWPLVSANPARASGLADRGQIAPGKRADLVLVDWPEDGRAPRVVMTLSAGRIAYLGGDVLG